MSDGSAPSAMLHDAQQASLDEGVDGCASHDRLADFRAAGLPKVMLVEDDFVLRGHLAELLTLEGCDVTCAADGAEALQRLRTEPPPSVILVDILMPRLNGIAFRKLQLETPELRDIPTVALTSLADIDDRADLRFADMIKKPVNLDRLLQALALVCPGT